jgi:hypothetical protein
MIEVATLSKKKEVATTKGDDGDPGNRLQVRSGCMQVEPPVLRVVIVEDPDRRWGTASEDR